VFTTTPRIERLQSLIEADGYNQSAHFLLGQEYLREGRYMEAAAKFRRVVELNPEHGDAWNLLGAAYERVGVAKEAVSAYVTAATVFRRLKNNAKATVAQEQVDRVTQDMGNTEG
jgi:Flp pilus assembly protein TadD